MGIVGEFYRVEDKVIDYFVQHPREASDFFLENYCVVYGKYHNEPDRHFYADKAWDIGLFLLQSCDPTKQKILGSIKGRLFDPDDWDTPSYIKSPLAKEIAEVLAQISIAQLRLAYNRKKIKAHKIYGAQAVLDSNWEYHLQNTQSIISAFTAAKRYGDGIVIYYC
jgi:hypothetical protein